MPRAAIRLLPLVVTSWLWLAGTGTGQEPADPPVVEPLSGALYLDAWQVGKEVLVRPLVLQEWIPLGIGPETRLDAARRSELEEAISQFLAGRCAISQDGEALQFELERASFIEPNPNEFIAIDPDAVITAGDSLVSVVYAAPLPSLDSELTLAWDLFPAGTSEVRIGVVDAVATRQFRVTPDEPRLEVRGRFEQGARSAPEPPPAPAATVLKVPWLAILLVLAAIPVGLRIARRPESGVAMVALVAVLGAGAAAARKAVTLSLPHPAAGPDEIGLAASEEIVDRLLRGVYHAFDFREESQQYDVLSEVVGGGTLTEVYVEVRRTLDSRQREGTRVRVIDLAVEEARPEALEGRRGFSTECTWQVSGRVGHWGHFHNRANGYRARLVVEPVDGRWKLTGLELLAREREDDEQGN